MTRPTDNLLSHHQNSGMDKSALAHRTVEDLVALIGDERTRRFRQLRIVEKRPQQGMAVEKQSHGGGEALSPADSDEVGFVAFHGVLIARCERAFERCHERREIAIAHQLSQAPQTAPASQRNELRHAK